MNDATRRDVRESFLADMAEAERVQGKLPDTRTADGLASRFLEGFEQRQSVRAGRQGGPPPAVDKPPERRAEVAAKERGCRIVGEAELPAERSIILPAGSRALAFYERIRERFQLLMTKPEPGPLGAPSWRDRAMAVLALSGRPDVTRKQKSAAMIELIEASSTAFGDWRRAPAKPVHFHG